MKRSLGLDCLGLPALLQAQAQGIDVSQQLRRVNRPDLAQVVARHKYGVSSAEDRTSDGVVFASKLEAMADKLLRDYQVKYERQPRYVLQDGFRDYQGKCHRPVVYVGDFLLHDSVQDYVVDMKGVFTRMFRLKEKLLLHRYGLRINCFCKLDRLRLFLIEKKIL